MPSTGFYPFLPLTVQLTMNTSRCVNALNGLLSISTEKKGVKKSIAELCQCPQRASIHFYWEKVLQQTYKHNCVNALNGLLSISTLTSYIRSQKLKVCQCPQRASIHFYRVYYQKWKADSACQCPQRASIHFY